MLLQQEQWPVPSDMIKLIISLLICWINCPEKYQNLSIVLSPEITILLKILLYFTLTLALRPKEKRSAAPHFQKLPLMYDAARSLTKDSVALFEI